MVLGALHAHCACAGIATLQSACCILHPMYVQLNCKANLTEQTLSLQQASSFTRHARCNCIELVSIELISVCISAQTASQAFKILLLQSTSCKQWGLRGWTAMVTVVPSVVLSLLTSSWYHSGRDVLS